MKSEKEFVDKLVFDNCYNFLKSPVIVTSGESITPFFLNGENVIGLEAKDYIKYKMDPVGMYNWVVGQLDKSPDFKRTMNFVRSQIDLTDVDFISGGRTRDWPFSSALAYLTGKDALFLYKPLDGKRPLLLKPTGEELFPTDMDGVRGHHIVDLVTTASSVVNKGYWLDQTEDLNSDVEEVTAVIDRNQGAAQNISKRGAKLNSIVKIDEFWTQKYDSKNSEVVQDYLRDPQNWTKNYLLENGVDCLLPYFNPETSQAKKDNRLLKFVLFNNDMLKKNGILENILSMSSNFRAVEDKEMGVLLGETYNSAIEKYK